MIFFLLVFRLSSRIFESQIIWTLYFLDLPVFGEVFATIIVFPVKLYKKMNLMNEIWKRFHVSHKKYLKIITPIHIQYFLKKTIN